MIITTRFQPGNVVKTKDHISSGVISSIEVFTGGMHVYHVMFNADSPEPTCRSYGEDDLECIAYTKNDIPIETDGEEEFPKKGTLIEVLGYEKPGDWVLPRKGVVT